MGYFKQKLIEYDDRGYGHVPDRYVCRSHFDDSGIIKFFKTLENQYTDTSFSCSYCEEGEQIENAISLSELIEFICESINHFYGDANDEGVGYDSSEGGWMGEVFDTYDLFNDYAHFETRPFSIFENIRDCFNDKTWCIKNPYNFTEAEELRYTWDSFVHFAKHKMRFFHLNTETKGESEAYPAQVLHSIGEIAINANLIRELPRKYIYRVRQHSENDIVSDLDGIGSPPPENAKSNRMSPAGISMFYSSYDKKTSLSETLDIEDKTNAVVSIGKFESKRINVLDLTLLDKIELSIYDKELREIYYAVAFLKSFAREVSKPIKRDDKIHIEYVPTQIVAEYFRHIFPIIHKKKIEGIVYKSSQDDREVCVLFADKETCANVVSLVGLEQISIDDANELLDS